MLKGSILDIWQGSAYASTVIIHISITNSKDRVFLSDIFTVRFAQEFLRKQFSEIKSHKHDHGVMNYGKL